MPAVALARTGGVRHVVSLLAVCLVSGVIVLASPTVAHAEPKLESSTPASGDSIPAGGPVEIVLRFNEELRSDGATLVLLDEDGREQIKARVEIDGKTLDGLMPEVPPGDYKASYRATTTSGDAVSGRLPFSISAPTISFLGFEWPSWGPTALIVLFLGLAAATVIAISASASRR